MIQEQHPVTPANTSRVESEIHRYAQPGTTTSRILSNILIGIGIALILISIESVLWIFNPYHLLGGGGTRGLSALLAMLAHMPFLLFIPLFELLAACILVQVMARPLAILAYMRDTQSSSERYRKLYTPLTMWSDIYKTSVIYHQDNPDPSIPSQVQEISLPDLSSLVHQQHGHLLLLGGPGAGKTTALYLFQYAALRQRRSLMFGRAKIPIYIPLKNYSQYPGRRKRALPTSTPPAPLQHNGQQQAVPDVGDVATPLASAPSLLDFLYASNLPGIHHLRPYLKELLMQGRLFFLCDGFHEVDDTYQAIVSAELAELLAQNQNRLVITSREGDYSRQSQLVQAVNESLVVRASILPLEQAQIRSFVEHYLDVGAPLAEILSGEQVTRPGSGDQRRHTAGQIMETINHSHLRYYYANPMLLFSLLEIIDETGAERAKRLGTRSRLLRAYVSHLLRHAMRQTASSEDAPTEHDVLLFLGRLACAARLTNSPDAIHLPVLNGRNGGTATQRSVGTGAEGVRGKVPWVALRRSPETPNMLVSTRIEELAQALQTWLDEHSAQVPFGNVGAQSIASSSRHIDQAHAEILHEPYDHTELTTLIKFAQGATLIDVSPGGILSFRHELIAAYLVGEYFLSSPFDEDVIHLDTEAAHHTQFVAPIAMWAGLVDDPLALAKSFVADGQHNSHSNLEALTLSLICVGVAWTPPHAEHPRQIVLPPNVEAAVARVLHDTEERKKLAHIFTLYAEEGAPEIYQSLFPLLLVDGIDEFVTQLDPQVVPELLFRQLCEIVDDATYEAMVKRLVRILGRFGAVVVSRASELTLGTPLVGALPGGSARLRSAAINILGGTDDPSAVESLVICLSDTDQFIVGRAINALIRLGPEHTLSRIISELENRAATATKKQIHAAALRILERFLDDPNVGADKSAVGAIKRPLRSDHRQQIINALLHVIASNYAPEEQQKAGEILVRQGRMGEASESGEKAVDSLVQNLASGEDTMARSAMKTLKEIGPASTPSLLRLLNARPAEIVRMRIVDVLGSVRDSRSLPYLLPLLGDPALIVQQQVAAALYAYTPQSIPGMIDLVLHSESEGVAARAEQVLGDIGEEVVKPVIQALFPIEPGRTQFLVHVLERVHDLQAIPALIALLEAAKSEQSLALVVIHTLGEFADERIVTPLLGLLESSNPLLYEGAINALSHLGDVALDQLIAALNVEQKTAITTRVQRALLGMVHFPTERLLELLEHGTDAQAEHIIDVFLAKGAEAAQIAVENLFHPNRRVQNIMRLVVGEMQGAVIVPALLEELYHAEPAWRAVIAEFLLRHPQEAIPPLVNLLGDDKRADAAQVILLEFGPEILPSILPGLDALNNRTQEHAQHIIMELVRQNPEILPRIVQLFILAPPQRAHEALVNLLANELADVSIPALLEGLEDAHLVGDVTEVLVRLVNKDDSRSEVVLNDLLDSLRVEQRRHGAEIALMQVGAKAVPGVGSLITDTNKAVAHSAQNILCEMGVPAFSFIWAAHSDTSNSARREAARSIFRRMPTVVIKDELVELLSSNEPDTISMALALLLERIHDEAIKPDHEHEMIPSLLEHVQTHSDERASLRILALLLLLGGNIVIDHMTQVLYDYPNHQERLIQAFLLLGEEAEEALLEMLHDPEAPPTLSAEAAGVLGMIAPHSDIREYARMPGEYGLWAGRSLNRTGVLQPERLAISLRALGGLLAGGYWDIAELQNLRSRSKEGSAERELYDILLGWRYSPRITMLENDLETEREEHNKEILNFSQQILSMRTHMMELEQELEQLRNEHGMRSEELEQATQEVDDLRQTLNQAIQEKQHLEANLLRLTQEKDRLQARNEQWSRYCDQLEQEVQHLKGP